jgi:tetratricopeptide (TPR) repeat protein
MSGYRAILLLLLGLASFSPLFSAASESDPVTAFMHVNVLTMRPGELLRDQAVVVRGGRIVNMGPADEIKAPADATVIDGKGAYLMPGLTDMHVHVTTPEGFLSFLAYGVTTVANLNGAPEFLRWRQMLNDGKLVGPNVYTAGPSIDGRPLTPIFVAAKTPEQAKGLVAEQKRAGYDWIKVYSSLKLEEYRAVLQAAKEKQIGVIGHIPFFVRDVGEVKGQTMVAHAEEFNGGIFAGIHPEKIPAVAQAVKEAGLTVTPNLIAYTLILLQVRNLNRLLDDPECAYFSPCAWSLWLPANNRYSNRDATFGPRVEAQHAFMGRFIKAFHDAGVPLLVGTDTEVIGFPGRSALEEIQELVDAGLTRQQALTAATKNAGDFVAKTIPGQPPFGTVAVGQRADLILLSANPLEDLQHLRQLQGVMARGRWWTSAQIAEMRNALVPRYRQIKSDVARLDRLIHQKDVPEAIKMFRSLRAAYPHEVFINQFVLQQALDRAVREKRLPDALEFAKMNVELQPDHYAVHAQLGRVYRLLGDIPAAEKCLNRSLELSGSNGVALEEMAKVASQRK